MALSLDDVLSAPTDPELLNRHLRSLGLVPAPVAQPSLVPPATVSAAMSPVSAPTPAPAPAMKPFVAPTRYGPEGRTPPAIALSPLSKPIVPGRTAAADVAAPEITAGAPAAGPIPNLGTVAPRAPTAQESIAAGIAEHGGTAKEEGKRQYQELRPQVTAPPDSVEGLQQLRAQQEFDTRHPWGGDISAHPGVIGKIGHVLGRIGNIAGDIVAPGTMANIPGTELNKRQVEAETQQRLGEAEKERTTEEAEKTREKHEENVSDVNEEKLKQAEKKLTETEWKDKSQREIELRKQGLKPDPVDPTKAVAIPYEDMSPHEQAVHDLHIAQADATTAKGMLDQIKADPNSPQNKAIRDRLRIMAQNAGTAAGKLGLDKKKFVADYFGTDENGEPLPGVQVTPEGKAIGPKVGKETQGALKSFNKDYIVPSEAVEKSYQMMNNAYNEYKAAAARGEQLPTGAESMLALSTHLSTTFGNVKGARVTKDMIQHHLGARSVPDSALVAFQRLTNGDVLSPDQWDAFHKLIGQSRTLSWKTAVKEGKRANVPIDFLPPDLQGEAAGGNKPAATPAAGGGVPSFKEWQESQKKP